LNVLEFPNSPDPSCPKQTADLRSKAGSAIISHDVRRSSNHVKLTEQLYERFLATKQILHLEAHSQFYSQIRQLRHFEGERFLPNSPTNVFEERGDARYHACLPSVLEKMPHMNSVCGVAFLHLPSLIGLGHN
jgi:hypothetical protein